MITFRLNTHSGVPPYLQIVQQVKQALQVGILQPGDQLPTVKEAVAHIAINPNTVAKAYRELESLGLVEGRTGSGTFIKQRLAGPSPRVQEALSQDLEGWIAKARRAGLDEESIEALVRATINKRHQEG
ncbi:MAG TPA: GntR family transcriptional regulator [Candidatus Saccharimonadales bacterium]|nr:GntR family transcriptional regulator [Candidatus Saccharimonadales bacterium]